MHICAQINKQVRIYIYIYIYIYMYVCVYGLICAYDLYADGCRHRLLCDAELSFLRNPYINHNTLSPP